MNTAFVLINAEMGSDLTKDLKDIREVKEFYGVYGVYDYVVRLEAETMEQLKDAITNKIRRMKNVPTGAEIVTLSCRLLAESGVGVTITPPVPSVYPF